MSILKPAPLGTLAWEQQHDFLCPDADAEYPCVAGYRMQNPARPLPDAQILSAADGHLFPAPSHGFTAGVFS